MTWACSFMYISVAHWLLTACYKFFFMMTFTRHNLRIQNTAFKSEDFRIVIAHRTWFRDSFIQCDLYWMFSSAMIFPFSSSLLQISHENRFYSHFLFIFHRKLIFTISHHNILLQFHCKCKCSSFEIFKSLVTDFHMN